MASTEAIRSVIASAHRAGLPARYELPTPAAATAWRHQVYRLRKRSEEANLHNIELIITKAEPTIVLIRSAITGTLTGADGSEAPIIPLDTTHTEAFDAAEFARSLGIELEK